ncbi:MAG: YceI family protein [Roseiarcus sp.]|uniref:YceI family protein n=1 Tax=Roseiarcus sp. TaxID=1969460 RepID=UPI003C4CB6FD
MMLDTLFRYARFAYAAAVLAAMPAPALAATNWKIDPSRTQIAFAIDAIGYPRTEGHFRRFEGRISVDFERPEKSSVAFHVQSGSVDVGSSSFSDYLRSAAFLDADRFPTIDFVSTSVQRVNDHMVRVSGDLTLLGVTKPLSVDVAVTRDAGGGRQRLEFQAETHIDRLEFGMNSGFPLVSRDVQLVISSGASDL